MGADVLFFRSSGRDIACREKVFTMARSFHVAIAGATGAVGVEILKTLESRNFPLKSLKLLASSRSAGKKMTFKGEELVVEEMTEKSFKGVDIALFSAGGSISKEVSPGRRRFRLRDGRQLERFPLG